MTERTITVVATGRVPVVPDGVVVHLGVEAESRDAAEALRDCSARADQLGTVVDQFESEVRERQTTSLRVEPWYHDEGRPRLRAMYSMTVVLPDAEAASRLIASAGEVVGDAIRIHGLAWQVTDATAAESEARAAAVRAGARQAEELARAAGVELGPLREINEPADRLGPAEFMSTAAGPGPPLDAGTAAVTVSVRMTFDLGPAG